MATLAVLVHSQAGRTATTGQNCLSQLQNDLIARASKNDYDAALRLGMGYTCGHFGLKVNYDEARKYLRIAVHREVETTGLDFDIIGCAQAIAIQYKAKLTGDFVKELFIGGREPHEDIINNYAGFYNTIDSYIPAKFLYAFDWFEIKKNTKQPEIDQSELVDVLHDVRLCVENLFMPAFTLSGILHCQGIVDGKPNVEKGLELLKRAAIEGGDAQAKVYLSEIYTAGLYDVKKDLIEAKKWCEAATEQNVPDAEILLRKITGAAHFYDVRALFEAKANRRR